MRGSLHLGCWVIGGGLAAMAVAAPAEAEPVGAATSQPSSQPASASTRSASQPGVRARPAVAPSQAGLARRPAPKPVPAPGRERAYFSIAAILAPASWWGLDGTEGESARGVSTGSAGGMHLALFGRVRPGWHVGGYFSWLLINDAVCQCGLGVTARVHLADYRYGRLGAAFDLGLQLLDGPRYFSLGPQLYPRVQIDLRRGPASDYRWGPFLSLGPLVAPVLARTDGSDHLHWTVAVVFQAGLAFTR